MRKILVLIVLGLNFCFISSKDKEDPVVMTIAGEEIPLSEFLFLAQKDSGVDLFNKRSLENYVNLFKNFKLKVADAKSLRIQESIKFQNELESYKNQLKASYLADKDTEIDVMRRVYERGDSILSVSHILFRMPEKTISKDTVDTYNKANQIYQQIIKGEDFKEIGEKLAQADNSNIVYDEIEYLAPLEGVKAFEDAAYSLTSIGQVSPPVRTTLGYHIIKLDKINPNPGKVKVAQILIGSTEGANEEDDAALLEKANEVYAKAISGEDFEALVKEYSADKNSVENGGVLPFFGPGQMVSAFEKASFALSKNGEISKPVKTRFGYHIIKLLDKKERASFEEMERSMNLIMKQGEWNFELFKGFEEKKKSKFGYKFFPEAYDELQDLCDKYHPTDTMFYNEAKKMTKTLMNLNGVDFPQNEFAEYLRLYPLSTKSYSGDFLYDIYRLFVRDIVTELERRYVEEEDIEYKQLVKEFHDGILLFEVSNKRVWEKPLEEQAKLEQDWVKELNKKFDVQINWKVLNNIKKYIN